MSKKFLVDLWVKQAANCPIVFFNPVVVAEETNLDLHFVFERLLELVKDKKLKLTWKICCPYCFRTLWQSQIIECQNIECIKCGKKIEINHGTIFPLFSISPDYKESVKKNQLRHIVFSAGKKSQLISKQNF